MGEIAIIVVTYNSAAHIGPCLDAAIPAAAEFVVVDNASTDGTTAEVCRRGVRLIANSTNRGFAAAVNQGIAATAAPYVLLLNPDAVLVTGIDALRAACDLPFAAGAGGALIDSAGRPQVGFMVRRLPTIASLILESLLLNRIWPGNGVNRRYRCLDQDHSVRFQAEQPAGAFLMIRRDVWSRLGGLDERFFPLWFEDVDFCRRAVDAGYRFYFVPESIARHSGGHSIQRLALEMRAIYWYGSLLGYSAKHFRPAAARLVCLAVMAGVVLRAAGASVLDRSLRPVAAYARVFGLAGRFFRNPAGGTQ